jgi:hypothetical protein
MERDTCAGRMQRHRRLARGNPTRNCLHPSCVGLPACAQTGRVPLCPTATAYVDFLGNGNELRDIFSAGFPDYETRQLGNPIQPGNTGMTVDDDVDVLNVLLTRVCIIVRRVRVMLMF